MAASCLSRKTAIIVLIVGVLLFIVSLTVLLCFPLIYQTQLKKDISLLNNTLEYNVWKNIPLPIYENLYFFNISNGKEFLTEGEMLNVTQVGPYTYKSTWVKNDIVWHPNKTVSYREKRTYHFIPEMSSGSEDDTIYTLNGPMIMAASFAKDANIAEKIALAGFFGFIGETIITEKSIKQLAYGGYEDEIINYSFVFKPDLPFKNGVFSWLYGKNDSDDGLFTVFTGEDDINKLNVIDRWNGYDKLNLWKSDSCNAMNGSSGEMGPPLKDTQQNYTFFQSFFCRSLTFNYSSDETHRGIASKRFVATEEVFGNRTINPDNACFETKPDLPTGVQDISGCQFGAPVVLSFPHFHMADPTYLSSINGLDPNNPNYTSYLDVEPITGISMDIAIRFQLNLQLSRVKKLLQFSSVPEGLFPVLWVEIRATVTQDLADFLTTSLTRPKKIAYSLLGILMGLSVILIVGSVVVLLLIKEEKKADTKGSDDDDSLLNPNADTKNYSSCNSTAEHANASSKPIYDVKKHSNTYKPPLESNVYDQNFSDSNRNNCYDDDEELLGSSKNVNLASGEHQPVSKTLNI